LMACALIVIEAAEAKSAQNIKTIKR